jgi:peptide/nickel transport system substrate-binding protein
MSSGARSIREVLEKGLDLDVRDYADRPLSLMRAGLSRRQLLRIVGLSSAAIAGSSLLAACSDLGDDSDDVVAAVDADDDDVEEEEPDDEPDDDDDEMVGDDLDVAEDDNRRHLSIGIHGLTATMDPNSTWALVAILPNYSVFEMLFRRDFLASDPPGIGNELIPHLAEDWEFVDDTTLEVRLREDVIWHNGDPMTADDVVFTFERILDEDIAELAIARANARSVVGAEQIDDYTVQIMTGQPDPTLEIALSAWTSWILPRNYYEEVGQDVFRLQPVGSGPYRVVSFDPGEVLELEAHDEYWMHRPVTSGVTMQVIPEVSTRISALISGEVDMITNVPVDQIETLTNSEGVYAASVESLNMHLIRFNSSHPNIADKRIRRALCHAIDRELLVDTLWRGEGRVPPGYQFVDYPDHLFFDEFSLPYDPDLSRELMEEAGYDGELINFRVHPTYYLGYPDAAQAIVEMWNDVGFNAQLELNEDAWAVDENQMAHNWSNTSPSDPALIHWAGWGTESETQRGGHWTPPDEYNELGLQQMQEMDPDLRSDMWRRMMEIWMDERPGTPLYNWLDTWGIREGIVYQPYGIPFLDLRNYNFKVEN